MVSRELPLLILNPKSGRGTTEKEWASLAGAIRTGLGPFEVAFTKERHDAIAIAEEEARSGRKLIVAVGGDGTISETANGIMRSGAPVELGIIPKGTGSDFCRTLKIPFRPADAARRIRDASARKMDVGFLRFINHEGKEATRYFVNTASFGLSGRVASRAADSPKWLGGTVNYAAATLQTIFKYDRPEVNLQWDDHEPRRMRIVTVCVANGPSFGGGMKIAPDAKLNDGIFDVVTIGDLNAAEILMNTHRLYLGSVLSINNVGFTQAKKVKAWPVDEREEILLEVDGETPGRLPATIEIFPAALSIRC